MRRCFRICRSGASSTRGSSRRRAVPGRRAGDAAEDHRRRCARRPNRAPADRDRSRQVPALGARHPSTVLFVGRFVEKKGLLDAIEAFARARQRVGARALSSSATVPRRPPRERWSRGSACRTPSSSSACGRTRGHHALRAAPPSSIRARPRTDGDSEGGAPTILLEAQAIGTPIVTTRHADIPNVVPEGPGVYLCDEHDVDASETRSCRRWSRARPSCGVRDVRTMMSGERSPPRARYQRVIRARAHAAVV